MDGIVVINKDAGMTSHDVVNKVRRITGERRCGHTGTLDPMASGVLVMCMGKSTRLVRFMMEGRKRYVAEVMLGTATDSGDADGEVTEASEPFEICKDLFIQSFKPFLGNIKQLPPMVSAVHHNGRRLYEYAREGIEVEREARSVTIFSIEPLDFETWPEVLRNGDVVKLEVECSKGTYIRTLACDICESIGLKGHLSKLIRTANSGFEIHEALTLEELSRLSEGDGVEIALLPPATAVRHLKNVTADEECEELVSHGSFLPLKRVSVCPDAFDEGEWVSITGLQGGLISMGEVIKVQSTGQLLLKPSIVFI